MIELRVAEGQHMTPPLPAAADIQRCSLGVVEKSEEVNNISLLLPAPCLLSSWVARPRMECGQEEEECACSSKVTGVKS